MKTTYQIAEEISGQNQIRSASCYFTINETLVRVANHLPNVANFSEFNEDAKDIILVFVNDDRSQVTDNEVENFIEREMGDFNVNYFIVNEEDDLYYAKKMIEVYTK